jgi:hypothetical protein
MLQDADALPQLLGEYKPLDQWQAHLNDVFYSLRGDRLRDYYQTFASADFRLAHALATDYYELVVKREERTKGGKGETTSAGPLNSSRFSCESHLTILELGPGNGNLAACFLGHLKALDKEGRIYPRVRYVMIDRNQAVLDRALAHPDLAPHQDRVITRRGAVEQLAEAIEGTVDRIICNESWNDLPTKLMAKNADELEEEYVRPNLSEARLDAIQDWSAFVRAFDAKDVAALQKFPPFLDDLVWEKEYRNVVWKDVPYRKTIVEFFKRIAPKVLVPVNLGAFATLKQAKRLLASDAIGFSAFDAGTADMQVLNDPEKPCYGEFGGQYSFMINFVLVQAIAEYLGMREVRVELQREFVGRSLNTNVITLMELLATHPSAGPNLQAWEQDRLVLKTIRALNETFESPYSRMLHFPLRKQMPPEERETLNGILSSLKPYGIPDTVAYLTEEELARAAKDLEAVGYDPDTISIAFTAPPSAIEYYHFFCR